MTTVFREMTIFFSFLNKEQEDVYSSNNQRTIGVRVEGTLSKNYKRRVFQLLMVIKRLELQKNFVWFVHYQEVVCYTLIHKDSKESLSLKIWWFLSFQRLHSRVRVAHLHKIFPFSLKGLAIEHFRGPIIHLFRKANSHSELIKY